MDGERDRRKEGEEERDMKKEGEGEKENLFLPFCSKINDESFSEKV